MPWLLSTTPRAQRREHRQAAAVNIAKPEAVNIAKQLTDGGWRMACVIRHAPLHPKSPCLPSFRGALPLVTAL